MAEVTGMVALDRRRKRLDKQPLFEPGGPEQTIVRFRPAQHPVAIAGRSPGAGA